MLTHNPTINYWFTGIDDLYPFELLAVALHSARLNTNLTPICLHTGLNKAKLNYLDANRVTHIFTKPDMRIAHSQHSGAILRMYIPKIANILNINEVVLYTDSDVIFLSHPPFLSIHTVGGSSYLPGIPPSIHQTVNSGVLYLNTHRMFASFEAFIKFSIDNPNLHNAAAESIYNHFYPNMQMISHRLNYFAYWSRPPIDDQPPIILHFHGPKPNWDANCPSVDSLNTIEYRHKRLLWRLWRSLIHIPF
jgi:lipopolysaccharide biosynthesis glycosyltransferase